MSSGLTTLNSRGLLQRGTRRLALTFLLLAVLLFVPAWSLRFWQAWLFITLLSCSWTFFFISFLRTDPQLLERRLQTEEVDPRQRRFQKLFSMVLFAAFIIAGLDFRFGWSRSLRSVPTPLVVSAQLLAVAAYCLVFWVMKTNTFAGSTIRIEEEQRVINHGPYALVRHPMYTGMVLAAVAIPLALGSYVALPVFSLFIPVLVYRLIHEEHVLRRDLAGYSQYCEHTRFRLVPRVW